MPNGTYGGVRGKETKVGQKTFVSRPTRLCPQGRRWCAPFPAHTPYPSSHCHCHWVPSSLCHGTHYHCPPCRPGGRLRQWSADMCQMSPRTVTCNNFVTKASHVQLPVIQAWTCIAGIMRPPWRQKPSLICASTGWNSVTLDHRKGMARPASAQTGPSSHIH